MTADHDAELFVELARRTRDGDVSAFERLFRELHAPLCEVADSYVRSQDVAEEIVQDLFFVLWMKRDRIVPAQSIVGYLFTAARNRGLHHLRHRAIVRRWAERADTHPDVTGTYNVTSRTDDETLDNERSAVVRRAIDQLPTRARLAVVLRWQHQMSHAEVAAAMGISNKGVEKLLSTAKAKLRLLLGAYADELMRGDRSRG